MEQKERRAFRKFLDRVFVEREIILRVDGKVRYARLSRRTQQTVAVFGVVVLGWLGVTTSGMILQWDLIADRDREISQHKLNYLDLLAEVSEYQGQMSDLMEGLEANQARLLAMVEQEGEVGEELAQIKSELAGRREERTRVAVAHEALKTRLDQSESDLKAIADRNTELRNQVANLTALLDSANSDRKDIGVARDELEQMLAEVKSDLKDTRTARDNWKASTATLRGELDRSQMARKTLAANKADLRRELDQLERNLAQAGDHKAELGQTIASLEQSLAGILNVNQEISDQRDNFRTEIVELDHHLWESVEYQAGLRAEMAERELVLDDTTARSEQIAKERDGYRLNVADLARRLTEARARQAEVDQQLSELQTSFGVAQEKNTQLEKQGSFYEARVASLERRLEGMLDTQKTVIKRLTDRTLIGMDTIERIVEMTGVDLNDLMTRENVQNLGLNQGGPFVPGDYISETDTSYQLQASVTLLEMQMSRWEGLQELARSLPLIAPVDSYRITSGYGIRKDPVNGRKGRHEGIDFAAPMRTPVFTTAPGKVVFAGWRGRYGRMVVIDHGLGISTSYAHLRKILVKPGQVVSHREKIGLLGNSGRSTGPHVHYEVLVKGQPVDPSKFLEAGRYVFKG